MGRSFIPLILVVIAAAIPSLMWRHGHDAREQQRIDARHALTQLRYSVSVGDSRNAVLGKYCRMQSGSLELIRDNADCWLVGGTPDCGLNAAFLEIAFKHNRVSSLRLCNTKAVTPVSP